MIESAERGSASATVVSGVTPLSINSAHSRDAAPRNCAYV
ncbi:Uncharacterised protein [Mycobacteroides abscessus subsp. abscessus]|nr:Uncharacterised protein [Mycobacteroides abscessus subsp. abscessus]SKT10868.1 Uncharacterised protein [Mycobacteroides abscessus subsp. abscessus]SKU81466.1 Uncharacterised protein [Mycobacteroides abscessus subsp. abscessus]SKU81480.1 Uncharacterised protein [Mycobacteroides abscessus subsp. abscessus]